MPLKRVCTLIGAPIARGQKLQGVGQGPQALREGGLLQAIQSAGVEAVDVGDVQASDSLTSSLPFSQEKGSGRVTPASTYDSPVEQIQCMRDTGAACQAVHKAVMEATRQNSDIVVTVGGDHSVGTSTVGAGLRNWGSDLRVLWVDAHADLNCPEDSPSGNYHGMPVAHLMGDFPNEMPGFEWLREIPILKPSQIVYIGLRDVDIPEKRRLREKNISVFSMDDVTKFGIGETMRRAMEILQIENPQTKLHVSFDIDACDPEIAPGTGTRARGGLNYREALYICREARHTGKLTSFDLVEVNPILDRAENEILHGDDPSISPKATMTVRLAIELIQAAVVKELL